MTSSRLILLALTLTACGNRGESSDHAAAGSAAVTATASSPAPTASAAASGAATGDAPTAAGGETWKGSFKARPGAVVMTNKEASQAVKVWANDPGTAQVGDGTMTLTVGGAPQHLVRGEIDGALGPMAVTGAVDGGELRARVDSKDPNAATAMTGILYGKFEGANPELTLRVSSRNANVVREATIKLAK